jgi:nucleoside-diphosphate-sugar epimerase
VVQHQQVTYDERLPEPVVILGGGGFIGSNLGEYLHGLGYDVHLVDVAFTSWRWPYNHPDGKRPARWSEWSDHMHVRDLTYRGEALAAVEDAGTVFHLAADMGGVEFFHSDKDFGASQTNAQITLNVVNACVAEGVQRMIYTSSACAAATKFQDDVLHPCRITEHDITWGEPDARYGAEKRYGAYMVSNAPIDGRVAVLATVYGPGQEFEGVRRKFPSAVCTNAIDAVSNSTDLVLFGDGRQIRTYLYIDDAVERLYKLALASEGTIGDGIFNIGAEHEVSCANVANLVLCLLDDAYGVQWTEVVYDPTKPTGVAARGFDISKWRSYFGPTHETGPVEGFRSFLDWLKGVV